MSADEAYLPPHSQDEPPAPSDASGVAAITPGFRVLAAFVALLLGPGAGHMLMGRRRAGLVWMSTSVVLVLLCAAAVCAGQRILFAVLTVAALGWRLGAAVEPAVRVPGPAAARSRWALVLVVGAISWGTSMGVRFGVAQAFKVPSGSMAPTLNAGDHLMVSRLSGTPGRGEVIVHRYPRDPSTTYVKRVVGIGGDQVEIRAGILRVNGSPVPTSPSSLACPVPPGELSGTCHRFTEELDGRKYDIIRTAPMYPEMQQDWGPYDVPAGQLFVIGDNRDNSSDSRFWGPVPVEMVVGRVMFRW